jgi:hypothetical protein
MHFFAPRTSMKLKVRPFVLLSLALVGWAGRPAMVVAAPTIGALSLRGL